MHPLPAFETCTLAESAFEFGTTPFYFLRHGETYENRHRIVQGQDDTEMNAAGRQNAEAAAETLTNISLASIYASPLKRAWRTAWIVSNSTGAPVFTLPGLMERHWGKYQGRSKAERPVAGDPTTVEPLGDFRRRVTTAIESISGPAPVLVVAHSGVFRAICSTVGITIDDWTSVTGGEALKFEPPTATRKTWRISAV